MFPDPCYPRPARILAALLLVATLGAFGRVSPLAAQGPPSGADSAQGMYSLSVEGSGGLAVPGGEAAYRLRVVNQGDALQRATVLSQTLPFGLTYVPGSTHVWAGGHLFSQTDPVSQSNTLAWGPFTVPAAGHTAHNSYGIHTFTQDLCNHEFIDLHLDQALALVGSGGYVTQLFYRITAATTGPDECAAYFVNAAYDRNLVPILRLQGEMGSEGIWIKPDAGADGDYSEIAQSFADYVAGLPLRNTHPLYVSIWNEPDLWIEWSNAPNAQQYGRFFVAVSNTIRALNDDRIRILNAPVTPSNTTFIRQMLQVPGFVDAFDVWASHCYPYNHPPGYNIHNGTARYTNATIDCYLVDGGVIERYGGRTGFQFIVKETGYGLGDDVYGFEGYPAITESSRAQYIADAFRKNWRTWPELITATPYQMGDPWSGWENLDWIDYDINLSPFHFSFEPHTQYTTVAALAKPHGDLVPRSLDISFVAQVDPGLVPGSYSSEFELTVGGTLITTTETAAVRVTDVISRTHFPLVSAATPFGVGVMATRETGTDTLSVGGVSAGAIVPTRFLSPADEGQTAVSSTAAPAGIVFDGRQAVAVTGAGEWWHPSETGTADKVYVALSPNELAVVRVSDMVELGRMSLTVQPILLTPGPTAETLYALTSSGQIVLVDSGNSEVSELAGGNGGVRDMVFDSATAALLLADARHGSVIRFAQGFSEAPGVVPLEDLPDQLFLDADRRRLYVILPGINTVLRLNADTLIEEARFRAEGGPILDAAYEGGTDRMYILNLLSPRHRGVSVLVGDALSMVDLVAGSPQFPMQDTVEVAPLGSDQLLLSEGRRLLAAATTNFTVLEETAAEPERVVGTLTPLPAAGCAVWLSGNTMYRYP